MGLGDFGDIRSTRLFKYENGNCFPLGDVSDCKEYRYQPTNQIIGSKTFEYNHDITTSYINQVLSWWDGKRKTTGVEIEEAYRCRTCEYEEGCSWRTAKLAELAQQKLVSRITDNL